MTTRSHPTTSILVSALIRDPSPRTFNPRLQDSLASANSFFPATLLSKVLQENTYIPYLLFIQQLTTRPEVPRAFFPAVVAPEEVKQLPRNLRFCLHADRNKVANPPKKAQITEKWKEWKIAALMTNRCDLGTVPGPLSLWEMGDLHNTLQTSPHAGSAGFPLFCREIPDGP
jgi:hypothetical protein